MKRISMVWLAATMLAGPSLAATALSNGTGDGKLQVTVGNAGDFGSASTTRINAIYDPVGATAPAGTTYLSSVYLGFGGARTNLSQSAATVVSATDTSVSSTFTNSGLAFTLVQTLSDLVSGGMQAGSLLTQTYSFTNTTANALTFDLVRYLDGDLTFNNTNISDGGGRFINTSGQEILFETDTAIGSADSDTFIGILNDGGTSTGYEIASFSGLVSRIITGQALANVVENDGSDSDEFIDAGRGYDVTLGLGRAFSIAAGESGTFVTQTIFGTGTPSQVVIPPINPPTTSDVPEPASWALMLAGFGVIGGAMRRRRTAIRFA